MSEAQHKAQGIVGISLMVQIGDTPNPELRIITSTFNKVLYKGECRGQVHELFFLPTSFSGNFRMQILPAMTSLRHRLHESVLMFCRLGGPRKHNFLHRYGCLLTLSSPDWVERRKCLFHAYFNYAFIRQVLPLK